MAEERLIDADKDKKYRIKVNEDGEEELVVIDAGEGEEAEKPAEVLFEVAEAKDDEEEAVMTPEQLAAKREQEEKERQERQKRVDELLEKASADIALYRYATALEFLEKAEEIDGECGEIYALKLIAYTRGFSDYSQIIPAATVMNDIKKYTSEERKAELLKQAEPSLEHNIAQLRASVTAMDKENEEKKAERAVRFEKDRNVSLIVFFAVFAVLAAFGGLTGYFASVIYTVSTGKFLILTCVFGAFTLVALLALALAARRLNVTCRRVRLNKRNTSTQLGRDLLKEQAKLKAFIAVYSALKGEK